YESIASVLLLHGMRKLVREQVAASSGAWRVLAITEDDVAAHGVSAGVHLTGGLRRGGIRMHAYTREVMVETSLHESPRARIERRARGAQRRVRDWRRCHRRAGWVSGAAPQRLTLLVFVGAPCTRTLHAAGNAGHRVHLSLCG